MNKTKVLIADDSVVYRSSIRSALQGVPSIEVLGTASHGRIAVEKATQQLPDLLILDLEMPEMDGLQTLVELKKRELKCKVLVFSAQSKRGAEITLEALRLGASDFISKPDGSEESSATPAEKIRALLLPKIAGLFPNPSHIEISREEEIAPPRPKPVLPSSSTEWIKPKIILIGSSTGGPAALEKVFSKVRGPLDCPIIIAQHMPPIFTTTFAERLSRISGIPAAEGKQGETLQKNRIYVAPGNYHLRIYGSQDVATIGLNQDPQIHSVRPAVDPLFSSAAAVFGSQCLAFVLSGMGIDGRDGAVEVKQAGGRVVIQSEESCTVFGMPGAVLASGAFDKIANLDEIAGILNDPTVAFEKAKSR